MSRAARFITLEGIEGVGKTTQIAFIAQLLAARNIDHWVTREPGGTPLAEKMRSLALVADTENLPPMAELLLMFAARSVHLTNAIEPALKVGRWVLCDRFTDATYAYQGAGRGIASEAIEKLEWMVQGTRRPDLTLLLDAPVEIALERASVRSATLQKDRFERERHEFFERVRAQYLARAAAEPQRIKVVDANAPPSSVRAQIQKILESSSWMY